VRIHFEIDEQAGRIVLTPITRGYIHRLRGKYKGRGLLKALMREKRDERSAVRGQTHLARVILFAGKDAAA